jgi:hypothetical protein
MNSATQGFGQPLAPGATLAKGVTNKQVRFVGQPPLPSATPATPVIQAIPATGVPVQPGGKRRRRNKKTTKRRKTNKIRKTRRYR